jgi:hypothetical protein
LIFFLSVCETGPENTGGEKRRAGHGPLVHKFLTEPYQYRPVRAHSCPGQGKYEASSRRAWSIITILMDKSQKFHFCCKLPEDVKICRHSEIFKPEKTKEKETTWRADPVKVMDNKEKIENRKKHSEKSPE